MQADISSEDDCRALVGRAIEEFGRIDILHNNVGTGDPVSDTTNLDLDAWQATFDVNLSGAMLLSKHVLPSMRERKSGVITNVSSVAAATSLPLISYKISRAALHYFTKWLAIENAPHNVQCNVLMLGFIDTPLAIEVWHEMTGTPRDELRAQRDAQVPLGRMGTPWEVASTAVFVASDDASFLTGAILPLDGAMHLRSG